MGRAVRGEGGERGGRGGRSAAAFWNEGIVKKGWSGGMYVAREC